MIDTLLSQQQSIVAAYLHQLQDALCTEIEALDSQAQFSVDNWTSTLGTGSTRVLANGRIFAKAGVNFSSVSGSRLPPSATKHKSEAFAGKPFQAQGVSVVIHPHNPYVPTTHFNLRYFAIDHVSPVWWFGGGYDLTPYYPFIEDCVHWHQTLKQTCDPFGEHLYPQLKQACDAYFYLPHRDETRGIGGCFFDELQLDNFDQSFAFIQAIGASFSQAYTPIVHKRCTMPFGQREKNFQEFRRGRYVEFNLLYDRGTLFGLQSKGRTESILMSLPPKVQWHYQYPVLPNSPEAKLRTYLTPQDWLGNQATTTS